MNRSKDSNLQSILREQAEAIFKDWRRRLEAAGGNYLLGLTPETDLANEMTTLISGLSQALDDRPEHFHLNPTHPLVLALRSTSQDRAARGFTPEETLSFVQSCKESLIDALHAQATPQGQQIEETLRIERLMDRCVLILASSFVAAREEVIRRQSDSLREASTPVITLWDSILLLPLVGIVDSVRAQLISERLLEEIGRTEAEVTLIDVTGVPVMDTSVARHIQKTVAAAEMLGTRVVLTGISPSTAQTMVKLGIDMSGVPTRGSLKSGLALALTLTGRRIAQAVGA